MGAVSLATLGVDARVTERWGLTMTSVDWPVFIKLAPLPVLGRRVILLLMWRGIDRAQVSAPYLYAVCLFLIGYVGLAVSACGRTSFRSR
jgi:cytochrome d ubiquinol oxidase subunit II